MQSTDSAGQPPDEPEPATKWAGEVRAFLDADDRSLLEECSSIEKLSRSDVLRRALRLYHRHLKQLAARSAA